MRKGVKTIIAGAITFVLGAFVLPLLMVVPLVLKVLSEQGEHQFEVPGTAQVSVEEEGKYYLWNDYQIVYNGQSYNHDESIPDGYHIEIRTDDGEILDFVSQSNQSFTSGSSAKKSIGYVEVEGPAELTIEVTGGNEQRIFSFSKSHLMEMFGTIFGAIAGALIVVLCGIGLIIWGIVKTVKSGKTKVPPSGGRIVAPQ